MGHAVYHRTASGEAQLEDVSSLEAALELVERLRNEDGPTDVRLFREIPVEVRTYYKVVAKDETEQSAPEAVAAPAEGSAGAEAPAATDDLPDDEVVADDTSLHDATVDPSYDDATTDDVDEVAAAIAASDDTDDADDAEVAEDGTPAPTAAAPSEPPAGAMPLLSPPPAVTVHADETDAQPAAATSTSGRPKLFNRG